MAKNNKILIAPLLIRITHIVNAIAVIIMIMSGLRIYNASPIFNFYIADFLTLGGWLAGALLWHFAFMWLLVANGLIYLIYNFATNRFKMKFFPITINNLINDAYAAATGRLNHTNLEKYNSIQKLAYLSIMLDTVLLVVSGLAIWKSVQFPILRTLMGGYDSARIIHFCAMLYAVFFIIVHLIMAFKVPQTLLIMTIGKKK